MWDIRGWQRLTVRNEPPLSAALQEFLSWLAEVPEPHRTNWEQRFKSKLDHPHLSVRLELYLHHHFKSNDWDIEIEPEMPGSLNRPDFRVLRGTDTILVEAKVILEEQTIAQETQRLRQLADNLTSKLSRDVIIQPLSDLPSSLPTRTIRAQIEHRARTQAQEILEFDLSDMHQGTPYSLKIIILPRGSSTVPGGVGGMISDVHTLNIGKRVRDALEEKAGKYGSTNIPFVIAIYWAGEFPVSTEDEFDALFCDRVWNLHSSGQVTESRMPNGFFTSMRGGKGRYEDVSAVLFYSFEWLNTGYEHRMHIYHNPSALRPLNHDLFPGVPQMVRDSSTMKWINGEPDDAWVS